MAHKLNLGISILRNFIYCSCSKVLYFAVAAILFLHSATFEAEAQNHKKATGYSISGVVEDAENKMPIEMAAVTIPQHTLWVMTDGKGRFTFNNLKPGVYKYEITYLGYAKRTGQFTIKDNNLFNMTIKMEPLSLGLNEVVVTAQAQKMGSSSRIDETAIQHIQPKSVEDLLQLMPGSVTKNPSLKDPGQAQIREISSDNNRAMGTAVMLDGAPLSNDANLQTLSASGGGAGIAGSGGNPSQSVSGRGVDLRSISPDNIESVEVIRGIPSAEYGNLTSGVVIIKSKSGKTPLEAKAKVDPFSKMVYAGKGFNISERGGAVNLSADYSQSYSDIRRKFNGYERITGNVGYSNTFMRQSMPLTLNAKMSFYTNLNTQKSDPELKPDEKIKSENTGYRFNLEGNWALNKNAITNLGYSFMAEYSEQRDSRSEIIALANSLIPYAYSYEDKEYETSVLKSGYLSHYMIEGKPLDLFAQIKGNRMFELKNGNYTNVKAGIEWRNNGNNGRGLMFDFKAPPLSVMRPRSFKDIPSLTIGALFIEDKTMVYLGKTSLTIQAGVRLSDMFLSEKVNHDDIFTVEPRINLDYQILNKDNNKIFDDLSIVGGFGISTKAPSMLYLYPDKAYFDDISLNRYSQTPGESLYVMNTNVVNETSNSNLKPATSQKFEVGLAVRIGKFIGNITYFNEHHKDEFSFRSVPYASAFNKYELPTSASKPSYANGQVSYWDNNTNSTQIASATQDTTLYTYFRPQNGEKTFKQGIEYSFNFGQIPVIKTSVVIDGAWMYIKRNSAIERYERISSSIGDGKPYPYIAIQPGGEGEIRQRTNTNFRFITHIPKLKLIFSTTAQVVWHESVQEFYENNNGEKLNYEYTQGNLTYMAVNPIGFYDKQGNVHSWLPQYENNSMYRQMINMKSGTYYDKETYPPTVLLNFRLTKEFGKIMELSFMANNFLNLTKSYKYKTRGGYRELMIPMYFGAEIKINI